MSEHEIPPRWPPEPNTQPDAPASISTGVRKCLAPPKAPAGVCANCPCDIDAILRERGARSIHVYRRDNTVSVVINYDSGPRDGEACEANSAACAIQRLLARPRP